MADVTLEQLTAAAIDFNTALKINPPFEVDFKITAKGAAGNAQKKKALNKLIGELLEVIQDETFMAPDDMVKFQDETIVVIKAIAPDEVERLFPDDGEGEEAVTKKTSGKKAVTKKTSGKKAVTKKTSGKKAVTKKTSGKKAVSIWREDLKKMISAGKFTRKQIIEKLSLDYEIPPSSVGTALTDSKNPKYNKFSSLAVQDEDGIFSFRG